MYFSGETYTSLQYQFRIHKTTISKIVPETCHAIYKALKDEYLEVMWNFFNFIDQCYHHFADEVYSWTNPQTVAFQKTVAADKVHLFAISD